MYLPYLNGTLGWKDLFNFHNEHCIFTSRILWLGLFYLTKRWDPLFQMIINSFIQSLTMIGLIYFTKIELIKQKVPLNNKNVYFLFSFFLIFSIVPYGWENTLSAFQSEFYLLFAFSIPSLWLISQYSPLSLRWWMGLLFAFFSFLSMAAGLITTLMIVMLGIIFIIFGKFRNLKQVVAILVSFVVFIILYRWTPWIHDHKILQSRTIDQFLSGMISALGWPLGKNFLAAMIRNLPFLLWFYLLFRRRLDNPPWFQIALWLWSLSLMAMISFSRSNGIDVLTSRYLDFYVWSVLASFVVFLWVKEQNLFSGTESSKKRVQQVFWLWILVLFIGISNKTISTYSSNLLLKKDRVEHQKQNLVNYLKTNDVKILIETEPRYRPYPFLERFVFILNQPKIRELLPYEFKVPNADSQVNLGISFWILSHYYWLIVLGFGLLIRNLLKNSKLVD